MDWSDIRQLRYAREFRIPANDDLPGVADLLAAEAKLIEAALQGAAETPADDTTTNALLADLGTGLWRIGNRLPESEGSAPPDVRALRRHVQASFDAISQSGIEVQDHTREIVTGGELFKVIAHQPTRGISRAQVIETIKPTIYRGGKVIQVGEVVVGTPDN